MLKKEDTKFKANPYNFNNNLISSNDITNIMNSLNINDFKPNNLDLYQTSFIHKSYCKLKDYEEYEYPGAPCLPLQEKSYETMEFLGDAILGSVVSSYLYQRFCNIHKQVWDRHTNSCKTKKKRTSQGTSECGIILLFIKCVLGYHIHNP